MLCLIVDDGFSCKENVDRKLSEHRHALKENFLNDE
jgi:hypothetical protein